MRSNQPDTRGVNLLAVCLSLQLCIYKNNEILRSICSQLIINAGISGKSLFFSFAVKTVSTLIYALAFALPIFLFLFMHHKDAKKYIRLEPSLPLYPFFTIIFSTALSTLSIVFLNTLSELFPAVPAMRIPIADNNLSILYFFINYVIFPAFAGEIFFRGIMLNELLPWGRTFAIFASAVAGGVLSDSLTHFLYYTILGLITGYFVSHTNSLWIGIFISLISNTIFFADSFLNAAGILDKYASLFEILIAVIFISGIFSCAKIDEQIKDSKIHPIGDKKTGPEIISCLFAPCAVAYYIIILIYA